MRNALVLLHCPWEHLQPMGYLTFVLCACNGLENKEVTGSSEHEVEADDSKGRWWTTVTSWWKLSTVKRMWRPTTLKRRWRSMTVNTNDSEDYNLTNSTEQEVKDMGYEHDDTLNCRTYV